MMKVAALAAAVPLALLAAVASLGVVVVDVREDGPGGHHLILPVPLVLARTAAAFVPAQDLRVELGEAARHFRVAREVLEELADVPDCELVRVEEPGEQVVVRKVGDRIEVRVRDRGATVSVNVPLRVALEILPSNGRTISAADAVDALWGARFTDLVEVHDGRDHVKIWVF